MHVTSGILLLLLNYMRLQLSRKQKIVLQDETRKKAASTYLVENPDIPPPRYQKDGTLPNHYPNNTANSGKFIIFL